MLQDATNQTVGASKGHGCSRAPPQMDVIDRTAAQYNETACLSTAAGPRAARRQWGAAVEGRLDATEWLHHEMRVMRELLQSVLPNVAASATASTGGQRASSVVAPSSQVADLTASTSRQDVAPVASTSR